MFINNYNFISVSYNHIIYFKRNIKYLNVHGFIIITLFLKFNNTQSIDNQISIIKNSRYYLKITN